MSQANKEVALKFVRSLCGGDVATLKTVITDDIVAIQPGSALISGTRGYAEVVAVCESFPKISRSGLVPTIRHLTAEEDRVAVEWEGSCTLLNGQQYNNYYHFLLFIRDGKVSKLKEYLDTKLVDTVLIPVMTDLLTKGAP